jgi:hypothetical protein
MGGKAAQMAKKADESGPLRPPICGFYVTRAVKIAPDAQETGFVLFFHFPLGIVA